MDLSEFKVNKKGGKKGSKETIKVKLLYDKEGIEVGEPYEHEFTDSFNAMELHSIRCRLGKYICKVCHRLTEISGYEGRSGEVIYNPNDVNKGNIFVCYDCRKDNPKFRDAFKVEPKKIRASIMGWQKVKDV